MLERAAQCAYETFRERLAARYDSSLRRISWLEVPETDREAWREAVAAALKCYALPNSPNAVRPTVYDGEVWVFGDSANTVQLDNAKERRNT